MKILIIEDAIRLGRFLLQGLEEEGYRAMLARSLGEARELLREQDFQLILVDRMLPDGDGLALIRALRSAGDDTPAICLSAMDAVDDRVAGLREGADDYLTKPFSYEELLARIDSVTRRRRPAVREQIAIGDLVIDLPGRRVTRGGRRCELTTREFDLLCTLARNQGRVLSRTQLLEQVWGLQYDPGTNVVDVYIRYLRRKLGDGLIHTVRGVGYVLDRDR